MARAILIWETFTLHGFQILRCWSWAVVFLLILERFPAHSLGVVLWKLCALWCSIVSLVVPKHTKLHADSMLLISGESRSDHGKQLRLPSEALQ